MKKSLVLMFLCVGLAVCFFACKKANNAQENSVSSLMGAWEISSFTGFEGNKLLPATINVQNSEEGEGYLISGFLGANSFSANIEGNDVLSIGEKMGVTKMMGTPDEMLFEDALLKLMVNSNDWTIEENKLTISAGDVVAEYVRSER